MCLILAFLIVKAWNNGRIDHEYAKQGLVSPRLQAKYGDRAAAETSRYGLAAYVADAWSDGWQNRTDARRAARKAAATAPPKPGKAQPSRWARLKAAAASGRRWAQVVVEPVEARPKPAPVVPEPAVPTQPTRAVDNTTARVCPVCGGALVRDGDEWVHEQPLGCAETFPAARTDPTRPGGERRRPTTPTPGLDPPPAGGEARPQPSTRPAEEADMTRPVGAGTRATTEAHQARLTYGAAHPDEVAAHRRAHYNRLDLGQLMAENGRLQDAIVAADAAGNAAAVDRLERQLKHNRNVIDNVLAAGGAMTVSTGEAVNYETTVNELEALIKACQEWLDQVTAALKSCEDAKNHIEDAQAGYKTAATGSAGIFDHLAAMNLDAKTLGLIGAIKEALPASDVDVVLALLEEAEAKLTEMKTNAQTALDAAHAALAHVVAEYGEEAAKVASNLGGDPTFLGSGGGNAPAPVSAGV